MGRDLNSRDDELQCGGKEAELEKMSWEEDEDEDKEKSVKGAVPPLFECPISLEVMSDPVTVCTGLTYDRHSIQQWLRLGPTNNNCPASGQTLHTRELIPNRTLAALIQKWRLTNPSQILHPTVEEKGKNLIAQIGEGRGCKLETLRELKKLAMDEHSRSRLRSEGVLPALYRLVHCFDPLQPAQEAADCLQEAVAAIALLSADDAIRSTDLLLSGPAIRSVEWVLKNGEVESRINAATVLERLAKANETAAAEIGRMEGITYGLLTLLQQQEQMISKAPPLSALLALCSVVSYRIKLAEGDGAIPLLIRLVMSNASERGVVELSMAVLESISTVGQGRWGIMVDSVALPTIVTNLLNVSRVVTSHALGILLNISKNCTTEDEIRDVVKTGVLQKIVALLHMNCDQRTKRRANHMIKILSPLQEYDSCAHYVIHL